MTSASRFEVLQSHLALLTTYTPGRYTGDVTLYRANDPLPEHGVTDEDMGWAAHLDGEFDVVHLPGDHFSVVSEEGPLAADLMARAARID